MEADCWLPLEFYLKGIWKRYKTMTWIRSSHYQPRHLWNTKWSGCPSHLYCTLCNCTRTLPNKVDGGWSVIKERHFWYSWVGYSVLNPKEVNNNRSNERSYEEGKVTFFSGVCCLLSLTSVCTIVPTNVGHGY